MPTTLLAIASAASSSAPLQPGALASDSPDWTLGPTLVLKGERHMGTNFLAAQLKHNFDQGFRGFLLGSSPVMGEAEGCSRTVERASAGLCCCCKHGYGAASCNASFTPGVAAHVVTVRHPFTWLVQMHHVTYEDDASHEKPFGAWLRAPITSNRYCYNLDEYADTVATPVDLWIAKVKSYIGLPDPKVLMPMDTMFDEEKLVAALRPLVDQRVVPTALYYTALIQGDRYQRRQRFFNASRLGYAPWGTTNDKGTQEFTREGLDECRKSEEEGEWLDEYTGDDVKFVLGKLAPELPALRRAGLDFGLDASDVTLGLGAAREPAVDVLASGARASRFTPGRRAAGDYLG